MSSEILEKIQKLSPTLKAKLSDDLFLDKLDQLESQYGIKVVLILLKLLLKELPYSELEKYLMSEYGFNQVLAIKIKNEFGRLIIELSGKDSKVQDIKTETKVEIKKEEKKPQEQEIKIQENKFLNQWSPKAPATTQTIIQNNYQSKEIENKSSQPYNQSKAPSLTFFKEDDEEIKKYQLPKVENKFNLFLAAKELAEKFNFSGKNQDLKKRLENIILSKLKEIRDDVEFKEVLMKKNEFGGLDFNEVDVENLLNIIKRYLSSGEINFNGQNFKKVNKVIKKDNLIDVTKPVIEEEDGLPVIKMPQNVMSVDNYLPINAKDDQNDKQIKDKILPLESKNGKINQANDNLDKKISSVEEINIEVMPLPQPMPYISDKKVAETIINNKNPNKPSLDDVKFKKQTFGPIEELENMTLIEFRRISADPKIAVNKIKEKIDLLEKQSFQKKIQGIFAWQRSEVNKFYRSLGQISMSEAKPIEEIIRVRLFAGKPTLSFDEFEAILELNKQLRF